MWFLDNIVEWLATARDWFYDAYQEVRGWVFPFYYLSTPLYGLYTVFYYLTYYFSYFNEWVTDTAGKVAAILSFPDIWSFFWYWFNAAENAWAWVVNAPSNILNTISAWWSSASLTIQTWISIATEGLTALRVAWSNFWTITFPQWTASLNSLWVKVDTFFTETLPSLINWTAITEWWGSKLKDVNDLIDTKLKEAEPFWAGWQDWRDKVIDFFTDPFEWLLAKFTDWFLGKE